LPIDEARVEGREESGRTLEFPPVCARDEVGGSLLKKTNSWVLETQTDFLPSPQLSVSGWGTDSP
jgi:hypothetical protein